MPKWPPIKSFVQYGRNKPEEQENEIEKTREALEQAFSRPKGSTDATPLEFITLRNLRKVIDRERLRKLLQKNKWYKEAELDHIYTNFLRIIGVLVTVQWPEWESFRRIFLDPKDPFGRPARGDSHLPFIDVSFLEHTTSRRLFELDQYIFCPIVVKENTHDVIGNKKRRLPFLNSWPVGSGGEGTVTKVEVEKYQIIYAGQAGGERNMRTKAMARKVIKGEGRGSRSYQTERRNLDLFKKGAATCTVILQNFASFVHGNTLNIIYPLADLDLHTFLAGTYGDFCNRAALFKPRHLFAQLAYLASALHFMHQELYIDGQMSECAHLDLKPNNVLVFWTPVRNAQSSSESDDLAGLWKISDFGLSVVRSREPDTGRPTGQRLAPGDIARELSSRERSSMQVRRGPGPWQPPEMQENRVTTKSDLWSFGCILATVLAFTLGGPRKVAELSSCRKPKDKYADDYFYTDGPVIKSEILDWLNEQQNTKQYAAQRRWIQPTCDLIRTLLQINRDDRGTAKTMRNQISHIWRLAENDDSMWNPQEMGVFKRHEASDMKGVGLDDVESVDSFRMDTSQELPEKNPHAPESSRGVSPPSRPSQTTDSRLPEVEISQIRYNTVDQNNHPTGQNIHQPRGNRLPSNAGADMAEEPRDIDLDQLPHRLREPSLSWPTAMGQVTYAKLETPPNTIQACLSSNGQNVAFLSKARVLVFQLDNLVPLQQHWPESRSRVEKISENLSRSFFRELKPSKGRHWISMFLAGSFVALCSAPSKGSDDVRVPSVSLDFHLLTEKQGIVEIYNTNEQGANSRDAPIGVRQVDVPETCGDIQLSSRGTVLLMSGDHLDLHFCDGTQSTVSLSSACQLQVATFTHNGAWLCAWYTTAKYYYWCIWDMETRRPTSRQRSLIPLAPNQSSNFNKILVPFSNKPWFIACDQYGNSFVIRKRGDAGVVHPPESIEESRDGVLAGVAVPDDLGMIFVRRPDGTSRLRIETARIPDIPGRGSTQVRAWTEIDRSFDAGKWGLSVTKGTEGVSLLICNLDGLLMRKKYDEFR